MTAFAARVQDFGAQPLGIQATIAAMTSKMMAAGKRGTKPAAQAFAAADPAVVPKVTSS